MNNYSHNQYTMVEALDGPAYVFSYDGKHLCHNQHARELMLTEHFPFKRTPDYGTFKQTIDLLCSKTGSSEFTIGNVHYEYSDRNFTGGRLVRFRSLGARDHLARLSASLDNLPWGLMTVDVGSDFPHAVFCNKSMGDFLDISIKGILGTDSAHVLHKFGVTEDLSFNFKNPKPNHHDFEKRVGNKQKWYRLHFIPYVKGRRYCLLVMEDTTNEKIREGKYVQSQRLEALGQLAGGVAHDFNNLLSIIDGYARLARKSAEENEDVLTSLERIMHSVRRGAGMTQKLLSFGNNRKVKPKVSDIGSLVEEQRTLLIPLLDASIELITQTQEGLYADAPQDSICQILLNLCINARDAMKEGGTLTIETGRQDRENIFLKVVDTGEGMSAETQSKMFDPFFTTKGDGTGLGLAMVYGMVSEMNGSIDVVSNLGEGTAITIAIPASREMSDFMDGDLVSIATGSLQGMTVLVAEDEPDLLMILSTMLGDMGLHVLTSANGSEALQMQNDHQGVIDFLLTDIVMPELNGVKLSEAFFKVRPETKVIFMSGYPSGGQMAPVALPDNVVLLPKPVKFESLAYILESVVA